MSLDEVTALLDRLLGEFSIPKKPDRLGHNAERNEISEKYFREILAKVIRFAFAPKERDDDYASRILSLQESTPAVVQAYPELARLFLDRMHTVIERREQLILKGNTGQV